MSKKKNKRKSNLKLLLLLLLLTTVFLVSASYAWFTANRIVSVNALDVHVESKGGLQISADGINWKTILQTSDLTGATTTYSTNKNQIPTIMEPVSTGKTLTNGMLDMFYGETDTYNGNFILKATKQTDAAGTTGKYIAFDIFLKTPVAIDNLKLTKNSKVVFKSTTEGDTSKGLENAARVAFLIEGNGAEGTAATTLQGYKGATVGTTYIWEPNYDVHTASGVANAYSVYGKTTTTTGGGLLPYNGVIAEIAEDEHIPLGSNSSTYFQAVTPSYSTVSGATTDTSIFGLSAGITKVRVYMWIEGQDVDCEDNASGTDISYTIEFESPQNNS